jgi:hypothetical protein
MTSVAERPFLLLEDLVDTPIEFTLCEAPVTQRPAEPLH